MKIATKADKKIVVEILSKSFDDNMSVNYVVKQGSGREQRIKYLMSYAFDVCRDNGVIYLSDQKEACALILYPERKRNPIIKLIQDLKLGIISIGLSKASSVLNREKQLKKYHPNEPYYYLWFIGVHPGSQNQGIGSAFFKDVLSECDENAKIIYLETSVLRNLSWYKKFGFKIFRELPLGYKLYLMLRLTK